MLTELLRPSLTLHHYLNVLERFLRFFQPLETALFHSTLWTAHPSWSLIAGKCDSLRADLRSLQCPVESQEMPNPTFFLPQSEAEAWGVAYVLGGSSLGGLVLAPRVEQVLHLSGHVGSSYFTGHGDQTRSMWGNLCEGLETWDNAHPDSLPEVTSSAIRIFKELKLHLLIEDR